MNLIKKTIHIVGKENKKGLLILILLNLLNFSRIYFFNFDTNIYCSLIGQRD